MPDLAGPEDLLALPYHTRQLIVVVDDVVAKNLATANSNSNATPNVKQMLMKAISYSILGPAPALIEMIVKAVQGMKERGMEVLTVGHTNVRTLTFPPGHPRGSVLYIGHPAKPGLLHCRTVSSCTF